MGQLIEGRFGRDRPDQAEQPAPGTVTPEIADAVDAFVTFQLLRPALRAVPEEELDAAAVDLMELAVEQRALLDALSPEDRCLALNLGKTQINAERMGFLEPPAPAEAG